MAKDSRYSCVAACHQVWLIEPSQILTVKYDCIVRTVISHTYNSWTCEHLSSSSDTALHIFRCFTTLVPRLCLNSTASRKYRLSKHDGPISCIRVDKTTGRGEGKEKLHQVSEGYVQRAERSTIFHSGHGQIQRWTTLETQAKIPHSLTHGCRWEFSRRFRPLQLHASFFVSDHQAYPSRFHMNLMVSPL